MSATAPITALTALPEVDSITEMAATYATMADELAGMVDRSDSATTTTGQAVLQSLGWLHVQLDELTATPANPTRLWCIADEVDYLRDYLRGVADVAAIFTTLPAPLAELHVALIDAIYRILEG